MATSSPKSVTETQSSTTTSERRDVLGHIVEERPGCDDCLSYVYLGRCGLWPQCPHHHPQELKLEEQRKKLKRSRKPRFTSRPVFTPEQKRAHFERVKETNGFDVGDVPLGSRVDGMLFPLPLSHCGRDHDNLAKLAIECYNEEHGTKYKFVKLVRVITSAVGGVMYYITFQAKDEKPGSRSQNFQTRVYAAAAKGKIEVKLCRLEQKKSTRRF